MSPSAIELRIARLGLLQRVSDNAYGCRASIAALFGRFPYATHDTVSGRKLCERANPWAQQFWEDIQGHKKVDHRECFLLLLEDRIMDMFGRWRPFFRILDCSELRYRYLNITVEPQCLVAGTVEPVPMFPDDVPQPSSQEIPEEPEAQTWVCDCTREGSLLCGAKFSTRKHIMHTQGGTHGSRSWSMRSTITNVCLWCQLVFSNRKTRGVNMK